MLSRFRKKSYIIIWLEDIINLDHYRGYHSFSSYLRQAKYLVDELIAVGQPMVPTNFNAIINTLGVEYGEMISASSAR